MFIVGTKSLFTHLLMLAMLGLLLHTGGGDCAAADDKIREAAPTVSGAGTASSPNRDVKAGIFYFAGYHMRDKDGKFSGYGIDLLNLISRHSHLNFHYTGYDKNWDDMLKMLKRGEIDVVTSARRIPQREEDFAFSLPVGRKRTVLTTRSNDSRMKTGDVKSYDGILVGVLEGDSQQEELARFARDKQFNYATREYLNVDNLTQALRTGEVDAILSSDLRKAKDEKVLDIVDSDFFYLIVRKEDEDLLNEINYAIEQINQGYGDWSNRLFYKYYGPVQSTGFFFTDRERAYMDAVRKGEKKITAMARPDRPPYSYVDGGVLTGILPDYFSKIMAMVDLPYEMIVTDNSSEYYEKETAGAADVIIDRISSKASGINAWSGRKSDDEQPGFFTDSYMHSGVARLTRSDKEGIPVRIAMSDVVNEIPLFREPSGRTRLIEYPTRHDAMEAVRDGEADAAYVFTYAAQMFVNQNPSVPLSFSILNDMVIDYNMFVKEDADHELVTILNKCIRHFAPGALNQLIVKYTTLGIGDMTVVTYLQRRPHTLVGVSVMTVLALAAILFFYVRARWSKRLLSSQESANKKMSEQLAIVEALSQKFTNVYAVNPKTGKLRVLKQDGRATLGLGADDQQKEYDYDEIREQYVHNRVYEDDREYMRSALAMPTVLERMSRGSEYSGVFRIVADDGTVHHTQFSYVDVDTRIWGTFILLGFKNIDEMMQKEQEQKDALADALAQARYANNAKTTFLNNMSHDIRTPMNAIIGFTSLAATHIDNKEQVRDYLGKITVSSNHLLSLINDVLDMSRIESGRVKIVETEVGLPEVLHDLKTIVQSEVKAKQLEFYIDTLDVTDEYIICDKLRLNQVLLNILSNATKYTRPGGMVSVRVIQTSEAMDGWADYEFCVRDTGIGMAPEFLKHVFEPFEREQTATVSGIQGTGLGLAITKNIVTMMGGSISVDSEEGKGSEFRVKFHFRVADKAAISHRMEQLADLRALVVDDDVNTCTSVSKMLTKIGMRPDWTTLAKDAILRIEFALEQNEAYSVYIIDWLMPDMNGIELVRRIRKIVGEQTPIIILTAYDWSDIEQEARSAGVTSFCSKPIFMSELRLALAGAEEKDAAPTVGLEKLDFSGRKVLLVDDNEMNREIGEMILEEAGFEVDMEEDGTDAVRRIQDMPAHTYDLILMDVQMPRMNGYDATRAIRNLDDKEKAGILVVAMTANAFDEDRKEAEEAGMNGYVAKPIDIKQLMATLDALMNKSPQISRPEEAA